MVLCAARPGIVRRLVIVPNANPRRARVCRLQIRIAFIKRMPRAVIGKRYDVMRRIGDRLDEVFDPWAGLENTELAFERLNLGVKTP